MSLSSRLLTLRTSPLLLKLPPYLSALCIAVGIAWLSILPLNDYSRETYISENAILPGQVHTYFGGSEHNVFRAYRQEVWNLNTLSEEDRVEGVEGVFRQHGLKSAVQEWSWSVAGEEVRGRNVYGLIQGPRADATEAMVLIAAWRNFEGEVNYSGVALALTLARYFKRWSVWSKDIIILIPSDSVYGPEAWVSAYHSTGPSIISTRNISALPIKAGALQAAVALDYPAGPWGQRFDKLDILYDGINGALPNLDLLNTAIQIASGQMGISCALHDIRAHSDSYTDRLLTIGKGILTQGFGHATGPHSAFIPYHVDAVTLKTVGDGAHDEMSLGKVTESLMRSINNLLEHFHQSFFFYILLSPNRFVSIGTYLPAAMIIAGNFTITALGLWVLSSKVSEEDEEAEDRKGEGMPERGKKKEKQRLEVIQEGEDVALVPKVELAVVERKVLVPVVFVLAVHAASLVPFYLLTHTKRASLPTTFATISAFSLLLPFYLARLLATYTSRQQVLIAQSFSLLLLGATLSTLATLNFSLALVIGLLCAPLSFIRPLSRLPKRSELRSVDDGHAFVNALVRILPATTFFLLTSPMVLAYGLNIRVVKDLDWILLEMAKGWVAQGVWTSLVVWGVWWSGWVVGVSCLLSGVFRR